MKCEEFQSAIEEYVDGELDEQTAQLVIAHIATCASCALRCEELRSEQEIYAHYQREVTVTPAIWQGVRARIEIENISRRRDPSTRFREWLVGTFGAPRFSPALTAAMMLIAAGITVGVMSYMNSRVETGARRANSRPVSINVPPATEPSQTGTQVATGNRHVEAGPPIDLGTNSLTQAPSLKTKREDRSRSLPVAAREPVERPTQKANLASREATPEALVHEAEQKYLTAIAMLSRDVNRRRSQIDPDVWARFDETLWAIDRTIADTRRTVREHSNDPVAVQYMLTAYAKKVEVLQEMAQLH